MGSACWSVFSREGIIPVNLNFRIGELPLFIIQQAFIRLSLSTMQQVGHPSEQASRLDQYL